MSGHRKQRWHTAPISTTCETLSPRRACGKPTTHAYPALRGGWAALCESHAANILPHCTPLPDLLAVGEEMAAKP